MKEKILEHFKNVTKIPRCSYKAELMQNYIIDFAKQCGCKVQVDSANNILCQKGTPSICLQAHYDMVCIGESDKIELVFEENLLKARNSTLGADNGMGMSIMFYMMQNHDDIECLFTSDEEVGLIGATNLSLDLASDKVLNLDGEEEEDIYVGCAGGVDIIGTCKPSFIKLPSKFKVYEVSVENLRGGHSGVDIDKGIDSAIKVLIRELANKDLKLISIEGGEMRNSIPKRAKAIVASEEIFTCKDARVLVSEVKNNGFEYMENSENVLNLIHAFAQGVREFDKTYNIPKTSINMGKIRFEEKVLQIDTNARSLADEDLESLAKETKSLFLLAGFEVRLADAHPAWTPNIGSFANLVLGVMQEKYEDAKLKAIHAGLECGMLIQKQKRVIEAVSIGPTIRYPHSLKEECDLDSVERIAHIVEKIIKKV